METNIRYKIVGLFTLAALAGFVFIFVQIFTGSPKEDNYTAQVLFTDSSVSGLVEGAAVNLRGLKVGSVEKLYFDQSEGVWADLNIKATAPLDEKVKVQIERSLLTGLAWIELETSGGSVERAPETTYRFEERGSSIEAITENLTDIAATAVRTMKNLNGFLSKENREQFSMILGSLAELGGSLNDDSGHVDSVISKVNKTLGQLEDFAEKLNSTITGDISRLSQTLETSTKETSQSITQISTAISRISESFDNLESIIKTPNKSILGPGENKE